MCFDTYPFYHVFSSSTASIHIHFYCMKKHRSPFSTKDKTIQVWLNDRIFILKTHKNHLLTRLFQLIISLSCVSPAAQRVNSGKPWCNSADLWAEHEWTCITNKEETVNNTDETGFAWLWRKFMLHLSHVLWAVGIYHDEDFSVSLRTPEAELSHEPRPRRGACWEMRSPRGSVNDIQTDSRPGGLQQLFSGWVPHTQINNLSLTGQL